MICAPAAFQGLITLLLFLFTLHQYIAASRNNFRFGGSNMDGFLLVPAALLTVVAFVILVIQIILCKYDFVLMSALVPVILFLLVWLGPRLIGPLLGPRLIGPPPIPQCASGSKWVPEKKRCEK